MSGYTNSLSQWGGGGQSPNFVPQPTSMAIGGGGPVVPQVSAYNPMSYADTMSRFGSSSPQLSFGSELVGGGYNASGGDWQSTVSIGSGRPFNATNANVAVEDPGGGGTGWSIGGALDKFKTLSDIVGTFGNIYAGIQMNKIAKQQLAFSKESYAENLKNQKKAYNNSSEARSRSAGVQNNWSDAEVNAHIAKRAM